MGMVLSLNCWSEIEYRFQPFWSERVKTVKDFAETGMVSRSLKMGMDFRGLWARKLHILV